MTKKFLLAGLVLIMLAQGILPLKGQGESSEMLLGGILSDKLALPTCTFVDRQGNIYVSSQGTHEILCFAKDFKLKFRVGGYGISDASLINPKSMAIVKDQLVVADVGMLKLFDLNGNFKSNIKTVKDIALAEPTGLLTDTRGRLFVSDPGIGKAFILEPTFDVFKILDTFKQPLAFFPVNDNYFVLEGDTKKFTILSGSFAKIKSVGSFKNPISMTTDGVQRIIVLDGSEIKIFTLNGTAGKTLSLSGKLPSGGSYGFGVTGDKYLVASTATHELVQIDESGKLTTIIDHDPSKLCLPECFEIDENGRIFVGDPQNGIIKVIDQRSNELFTIPDTKARKMAIAGDLLALVTESGVTVSTRAGRKIYDIPEKNALDIEFDQEGSLLVLKKDSVERYLGSEKSGAVVTGQDWENPLAISTSASGFAVADAGNLKIEVFALDGTKTNSINVSDTPRDVLMLSPQRFIVLGEETMKLVDQTGKVLRSYGKDGGPYSLHNPTGEKVSYEANLDTLTDPVAVARFGKWIYVLDRTGMRLVRHPKEVLLEQPRIRISPPTVDFKYVPTDSESEMELVIENIGGDSLEGYFTSIPKWIALSTRHVVGDEVIVKLKARTYHFIPSKTYSEKLVLESNAGKFEIPCVLKTPDSLPQQVNIEFQVGSKTVAINGKNSNMDIAPYIKDGSTMISLNFITACFGGVAELNSGYISVNFPRKNLWVVCEVGSDAVTIQKDDQTTSKTINPKPELKSGKACVPLQFFTDLLDCEVYWDKQTKKIRLIYLP